MQVFQMQSIEVDIRQPALDYQKANKVVFKIPRANKITKDEATKKLVSVKI